MRCTPDSCNFVDGVFDGLQLNRRIEYVQTRLSITDKVEATRLVYTFVLQTLIASHVRLFSLRVHICIDLMFKCIDFYSANKAETMFHGIKTTRK